MQRAASLVSIIDEHTRECLGRLVDRSVTADVLIHELDRRALLHGYPAMSTNRSKSAISFTAVSC